MKRILSVLLALSLSGCLPISEDSLTTGPQGNGAGYGVTLSTIPYSTSDVVDLSSGGTGIDPDALALSNWSKHTWDETKSGGSCQSGNFVALSFNAAAVSDKGLCYLKTLEDHGLIKTSLDGSHKRYQIYLDSQLRADIGFTGSIGESGKIVRFEMQVLKDSAVSDLEMSYLFTNSNGVASSYTSRVFRTRLRTNRSYTAAQGQVTDAGKWINKKIFHEAIYPGPNIEVGVKSLIKQDVSSMILDGFMATSLWSKSVLESRLAAQFRIYNAFDPSSFLIGQGAAKIESKYTDSQRINAWHANGDIELPASSSPFYQEVLGRALISVSPVEPSIVPVHDYQAEPPLRVEIDSRKELRDGILACQQKYAIFENFLFLANCAKANYKSE